MANNVETSQSMNPNKVFKAPHVEDAPRREPRDQPRGPHIDLHKLANLCGLRYFEYQEALPGQGSEEHPETRTAFFLHERGLETGLKFYKKRDMSELVLAFSIHRLVDRSASLVHFGGRRGCKVTTAMDAHEAAEVRRVRAELQAMKEQSAPAR